MLFRETFNSRLDKLVRPDVLVFRRPCSAFQVCGYAGLTLAVLLAMILVIRAGLSAWVMVGIVGAAVLTFLGLVMLTKIITGEETITCYRHQIAVVLVTAGFLRLLHQPILPYLDVTVLGLGLFLAFGRLGCLMVGCCHGRPHGWGVCYRDEHASAGFTRHLVDVRLFPVQLGESLWVGGTVLVGSFFVLRGSQPGEALASCVIAYGLGRFCFEFLRGDPGRLYLWGFSEAHWTSLILMCGVIWAELKGVIPFQSWHATVTAGLVAAMIAVALRRRFRKTAKHQLLHPRHVKEVAEAIEAFHLPQYQMSPGIEPKSVDLRCTSLGIRISASRTQSPAGHFQHYALSSKNYGMTEDIGRTLAGLILQLRHPLAASEIVRGRQGVFHLLIRPRREEAAPRMTVLNELLGAS